jgi:hypothetical protein
VDDVTGVTARQLDHVPTKLLPQLRVDLIAWITPRFPPYPRYDPLGMRVERVKIEIDRRILAQLVLEPVGGVGTNLAVLEVHCTGHELPV